MSSELQWRLYRQSDVYFRDLDAVLALHLETEEALGRAMDFPNLMESPVLEAWVAERGGVVVGGFYCEAIVEPVFFGRDPEVTASARRFVPHVLATLAGRSFRSVRIQVPRWIGQDAEAICGELERVGFYPTDPEYHHFVYDLRPLARLAVSRNGRG